MKIFELAKEIGVASGEIVKLLTDNDFEVKNHMTMLTDEMIDVVKATFSVEEKKETEAPVIKKKTDADYRPDEMIPCRSVFAGTLLFTGEHSGMTYTFHGAGDRRNVEYQDLKAAMLQQKSSLFIPDIVIEDENLIDDEHWMDIKEVYENMYDESDIKKVLELPIRDFRTAFEQLPVTAKKTIITMVATQIENGTFESYNKAKIIDEICGTRFDLKM